MGAILGSKRLQETWLLVLALGQIHGVTLGGLLNHSELSVSSSRWDLGGPCLSFHLPLAFCDIVT